MLLCSVPLWRPGNHREEEEDEKGEEEEQGEDEEEGEEEMRMRRRVRMRRVLTPVALEQE